MATAGSASDQRKYLPVADGLRGFAMLMVVTYHVVVAIPSVLHLPFQLPTLLAGFPLCVPSFFVISGFVLYLPAVLNGGDLGPLRRYAERRFVRVAPAYWFMLAALLLAWPFIFEVPSPLATKDGVRGLFSHLAMIHQMVLGPPQFGFVCDVGFGVNAAVWSLTTEAVFYASLPLVCRAFHRRPAVSLVCALGITVLWRFGCRQADGIAAALGHPLGWLGGFLFHHPPSYAWAFAVGMFMAEGFVRWGKHPFFWRPGGAYLHAFCVIGLVACVYLAGLDPVGPSFFHDYLRDPMHSALLGTLLLVASCGPKRAAWPYANAVSRFFGDVSYGAFLWHMIIIQILWRAFDLPALGLTYGTLALGALVFPSALLAGSTSRAIIERPLMRFLYARQARRF